MLWFYPPFSKTGKVKPVTIKSRRNRSAGQSGQADIFSPEAAKDKQNCSLNPYETAMKPGRNHQKFNRYKVSVYLRCDARRTAM